MKTQYAGLLILLMLCAVLFSSCSSSKGSVYKKNAVVSYYSDKFNGRKTASGEKFSNSKLTAAHRTLPFGTKIKVTNIENNQSVVVEINDRGPHKKSRELDLSRRAFMDISHNKNLGTLTVTIEIIK